MDLLKAIISIYLNLVDGNSINLGCEDKRKLFFSVLESIEKSGFKLPLTGP